MDILKQNEADFLDLGFSWLAITEVLGPEGCVQANVDAILVWRVKWVEYIAFFYCFMWFALLRNIGQRFVTTSLVD